MRKEKLKEQKQQNEARLAKSIMRMNREPKKKVGLCCIMINVSQKYTLVLCNYIKRQENR